MRLIYNPATNQFYAAFDLGLSPKTTKLPNTAWINLVIYSFDSKWRFRAASQDYYELFPNAFIRRIPADNEGIWVAFTDLLTIDNIEDFGIAFHETGDLKKEDLATMVTSDSGKSMSEVAIFQEFFYNLGNNGPPKSILPFITFIIHLYIILFFHLVG